MTSSPSNGGRRAAVSDTRESRSVVFCAPGVARLEIRLVPPAGPGQVRIAVAACGICQRELHVLSGRLPRRLPAVMGHEPVGRIDDVGSGVRGLQKEQWVSAVGGSSLSEYDVVDAHYVVPILAPTTAVENWLVEPVMCAVNAVNRIAHVPSRRVLVCGAGFMGNLVLQVLRCKRRIETLAAADIDPISRQLAAAAGVEAVFNGTSGDDVPDGFFDVVYECSGAPGTIEGCTRLVRNGGTLCLFAHHFAVPPAVVSEWHLRGIAVLNTVPWSAPDLRAELREARNLLQRGGVTLMRLVDRTVPLDEAPRVLMEMSQSGSSARKTVVTMAG